MRFILRAILVIFILLVAAAAAFIYWLDYRQTKIQALVYDCVSGEPVPGVAVRLDGHMTLLDVLTFHWDSTESTYRTSDARGRFSFSQAGDSYGAHLTKDGYLIAEEYGINAPEVRLGIVKETPEDLAYRGKPYTKHCERLGGFK